MIQEMKRIRNELDQRGIEWNDMTETLGSYSGEQAFLVSLFNLPNLGCSEVIYRTWFTYKGHKVSVIHGYGTYGNEKGLLETRIDECEPKGYMTSDDILQMLDELEEDKVYDEFYFVNKKDTLNRFVKQFV